MSEGDLDRDHRRRNHNPCRAISVGLECARRKESREIPRSLRSGVQPRSATYLKIGDSASLLSRKAQEPRHQDLAERCSAWTGKSARPHTGPLPKLVSRRCVLATSFLPSASKP